MKIVALLQNMWVRNPEKVRAMIARDKTGELRGMIIERALFAGCLTGRRLRTAFGDLVNEFVWDECSPVIADNPRDYHAPDPAHIRSVFEKHSPDIVICFSTPAHTIVSELCAERGIKFIPGPHPAARQLDVPDRLTAIRCLLLEMVKAERFA
jgi:hypothetical protein